MDALMKFATHVGVFALGIAVAALWFDHNLKSRPEWTLSKLALYTAKVKGQNWYVTLLKALEEAREKVNAIDKPRG